MDDKPVLISRAGLQKMEEELARLVNERRPEIADRIRAARDFGDISENSEYIEAKNEQGLVEGRILELEAMVRNAVLIEEVVRERPRGVVSLGARVTVRVEDGTETYAIVGPAEADPLVGRISNESPLGRALIGHRAGDTVEWQAPAGTSRVKIVRVV
ncbi:MAG TPA: transcription elongation factor GreA [Candidatus Acidoferrales bacterium]|nr:transcription elongation factor GreA [Candidatus Acidoferrales bacterium]